MIWHILPVDDIKPHEELSTCACEPKVEKAPNGDLLVLHNSYDGREAIEVFDEIVNK